MGSKKPFFAWVIGEIGADGTWLARCLNLDAEGRGDSVWDALDAVEQAMLELVNEDELGLRPLPVRVAEPDEWDHLWKVVRSGELVTEEYLALDDCLFDVIATQFSIHPSHEVKVRRSAAAVTG